MDNDELVLQDLVRINTTGKNEVAIAKYLKKLLDEHDITNEIIEFDDGRAGLIAEIGNGHGPILAFDGHEDTVALGDKTRWQTDPLSGIKIGDKIFGRGITDMKSGLAAGVLAMIRLKRNEQLLNGTFKLYATVGEETGELGAKQMVEAGLANHIDALLIGEPSGIQLDYIKSLPVEQLLPGIVMAENIHDISEKNKTTEQHFLEIAHKGAISYRITSQGITAHSSMPELGVNAIDALLTFYNKQQELFNDISKIQNKLLGKTTPVVTQIDGGEQPNTVPGSATMGVFVRTIPEVPHEKIVTEVKKIINEINASGKAVLSLTINFENQPVYSNPNGRLSQITKKIGEKLIHQSLPFIGVSGGTDASQFIKANPNMEVVIFGPGNITAHQVDEFVDAGMYHSFIDIYESVVHQYLK